MPGVILYGDSKNKLETLRRKQPLLFNNTILYNAIRTILDNYTFKLSARRDSLALFPDSAKKPGPQPKSGK